MPLVPFARQSKDQDYSHERLLNVFFRSSEGVSSGVLIGRSGITADVTAVDSVTIDAMVIMQNDLYFVSDNRLWKYVTQTSALTEVGDVTTGSAISMAASGGEIAITTNDTYYLSDGATIIMEATTIGAMTKPRFVVFLDGYFVVAGTVSSRADAITISSLDDGSAYNALDFVFAENAPDEIRGLDVLNTRLWVFGAYTTEKFWNAGNADFPLSVSRSETINKGVLSGDTISEIDNTLIWVAQNNIVYRSGGGTPQVISTPEIKEMLDASTIERSFTFFDRAHQFYAIRRTGKTTLCYDVTTGLWAERSTGLNDDPWIVTTAIEVEGQQYFGTETGKICTQSSSVYTDDGDFIPAEAVSIPIVRDGEFFPVSKIYMLAKAPNDTVDREYPGGNLEEDFLLDESGNVLTDECGKPLLAFGELGPVPAIQGQSRIFLQTSRDGRTWSNPRERELGEIGEYAKRIHWGALGSFRRAQFKLRTTDPVARDWYGITYA